MGRAGLQISTYVFPCLNLKAWIVETFFGSSSSFWLGFISSVIMLVVDFVTAFKLLLRGTRDGFTKDSFWKLRSLKALTKLLVFLHLKLKAWIVEAFFGGSFISLVISSLLVVDFVATFILFLRGTKDGFTKDLFWRLCDKRVISSSLVVDFCCW
ncbi:hypothetical protein C2G38_2046493 [Gigaspora rosea]|uniref:Uncharacterized protein n=1 Tax=Gigaspora rosea TaxID=44941 RepID=A0A397U969_9GLOM|nr:hypothetical protein C2G38_2046493 [Gigaspora rosea]